MPGKTVVSFLSHGTSIDALFDDPKNMLIFQKLVPGNSIKLLQVAAFVKVFSLDLCISSVGKHDIP